MTAPATTPSLVKERPTPALEARGVSLAYDQTVVFEGLDLRIETGEVTTLIGANGCGKSTLLKAFGRLLTPTAGTVELDGRGVRSIPTREVARRLAILPQKPLTPSATTVRDLVSRGRHPHQSLLKPWTPADTIAVDEALEDHRLVVGQGDAPRLEGGRRAFLHERGGRGGVGHAEVSRSLRRVSNQMR